MTTTAKIVVAGGFGAGKTTFVGAVSEIAPLRTEAAMTEASTDVDDLSQLSTKRSTTVAMDFGRRTLHGGLCLYLFGAPGQDRFTFMWDDLLRGAVGVVVLVDVRRLEQCFRAIDVVEDRGLPYVLAVNHFPGAPEVAADELREALAVGDHVPVLDVDARSGRAAIGVLVDLVRHALARVPA